MPQAADQVHKKFKLFTGPLHSDGSIGALADDVARFVREASVAPKSIGVEYVESAGKLVLTLGYRDDEPGYEVKLHSVRLGHVETLDGPQLASLEQALGSAGAGLSDIICHELYITQDHEFFMIFMTAAA